MKSLFALLVAFFLAVVVPSSPLVAGAYDPTPGVPVHFWGSAKGFATTTPPGAQVEVTGSGFLAASGGGTANLSLYGDTDSTIDEWFDSGTGTARMEPGKVYTIMVNSVFAGGTTSQVALNGAAPLGFRLEIDGIARQRAVHDSAATYQFTVRLLGTSEQAYLAAGECTQLMVGRVYWQVGLGSLLNGKAAGSLAIVDPGQAATWGSLFTPATLHYEPPSDEVIRINAAGGYLRQIVAKQAYVDIVTSVEDTNLTSTQYELRFYHPLQGTGTGTQVRTFDGDPYLTYRIEQGATNTTLKITSVTRNTTADNNWTAGPARTAATILEREDTGSGWPDYTWTRLDWNTDADGHPQVAQQITTSAGTTNNRTETVEVQPGTGTPTNATYLARTYELHSWGEEIVSSTAGSSNAMTTEFEFYDNAAEIGRHGFLKSKVAPGGSWEAYDYWDATSSVGTKRVGTLRYRFRPFHNTPEGVTLNATQGEVTTYDFADDPFGIATRPSSVETRVSNVLTAKSTTSYADATGPISGTTVTTATRSDSYGSGENEVLITVTKFFREDTEDIFLRNQIHSVERPDGVKIAYAYQRGEFDEGTQAFTVDPDGTSSRTATITGVAGSGYTSYSGYDIDDVSLVAGKSTLEVVIRDARALVRRTESHAWVSSAWVLVSWTNFDYDTFGHLTSRVASNGATYTCAYDGDQKTYEIDESGVRTDFVYDDAGRLTQRKKRTTDDSGFTTVITYAYDAAGRVTSETVSGTGTSETVVNSRTYDDAGRLDTETPAGLGAIDHSYDVANRKHTVTDALGGSRVRTYTRDGRLAQTDEKTFGSSWASVYYSYSIDATSGQRITRIDHGASTSARYIKTWDDWLGRRIKTETPGFGPSSQSAFVEENFYDDATIGPGRLYKTTRTGYAPMRFEYDGLGQLTRSGLDIDNGGSLVTNSLDRIQESDQTVESYDGAYWLKSESRTYFTDNSGTATPLGLTRVRLTGHGSGVLSETREWDAENTGTTAPTAVTTVTVNRTTKTVTTTTTAAGLPTSGTAVTVNGLAQSLTTTDGLTYTSSYDALERLRREKNPRHTAGSGDIGYGVYGYKTGTAAVESVTDAAGNVVAFTQYDSVGRPEWTRNAASKYTRFAYDLRGLVIRQWGDGTYPVEYEYNAYGEQVKQRTWRDTPVDFADAAAFKPANYTYPATTGDTTTWDYDTGTGLLWKKTDAAGKVVEYDYNSRKQVATRKWARKLADNTTPVTTAYVYDSATGELTNVNYNDDSETIPTPDLTYAYDRTGRVKTVAQATGLGGIGTTTFNYDGSNPWRLANETLPAFLGSRVLTRLYESATDDNDGTVGGMTKGTIKGRMSGFELGVSGNADRDLRQAWVYSNQPRLAAVSAAADEGTAVDFVYAYESNSTLVDGYTRGSFTVSRDYETNRDLVTRLESQYGSGGGSTRTRFDYSYDTVGRRVTGKQSGTAFAAYFEGQSYSAVYHVYGYNARSELESAALYRGDTPTTSPSSTDLLPGRRHEYRYDSIGNRKSSGATGSTSATAGEGDDDYTVNALNQYTGRENNKVTLTGTVAALPTQVAVDGTTATTRVDLAWGNVLTPANSGGAVYGSTKVYAALAGGGTGGKDLIRTATPKWFVGPRDEAMSYDEDGNLETDGQWTYVYNAENELVRMTSTLPSGFGNALGFKRPRLDFKYDHLGRRVEKRVTDLDASEVLARRFVYDGWNLVAELNGDGSAIEWSYVWGLDVTGSLSAAGGVGALVQMTRYASGDPVESYYPTYDGNGNVMSLLKASDGSLATVYEYDPFGGLIRHEVIDSNVQNNPFRFSTKYHDTETGLAYFGMRYYSATMGRFVNRDPIAESGGLNLYGFVGNNGVGRFDYLGMDAFMTYEGNYDANGNWVVRAYEDGPSGWDIEQSKIEAAGIQSWMSYAEAACAVALYNVDLTALRTLQNLGTKEGELTPQETEQLRDAIGWSLDAIQQGGNIIANTVQATVAVLDAVGVTLELPKGFEALADGKMVLVAADAGATTSSTPINPDIGKNFYIVQEVKGKLEAKPADFGDIIEYATRRDGVIAVFENGQSNDKAKAMKLGAEQLGTTNFILHYNPTYTGIIDTIESLFAKVTGNSRAGSELGRFLEATESAGIRVNMAVHSQGGISANIAISQVISRRGSNSLTNLAVHYNGAAVNEAASRSLVESAGARFNGFSVNPGDPVPVVAGGNFSSAGQILAALLRVPITIAGEDFGSAHTHYPAVKF